MKDIYIIANWKSNKTAGETNAWFSKIADLEKNRKNRPAHLHIILCVPYTVLYISKQHIASYKLPYHIGSQNISPFPHGSYTGEINGSQIKEFGEYVIIGHSERRELFHETEQHLQQKVMQAKVAGLKIIYCISDEAQYIPKEVDLIAFEPISAIGTGNAFDPDKAEAISAKINKRFPEIPIIYGGSVSKENINNFLSKPDISGVLLGKASLDASDFFTILTWI